MLKIFSSIRGWLERWKLNWLLFALGIFFILLVSFSRRENIPGVFHQIPDKLEHVGEFFLLYYAAYFSFLTVPNQWICKQTPLFAFLFSLILAAVSEFGQLWISYRSYSTEDWLANSVGACLGFVSLYSVRFLLKIGARMS